MIEHDLDSGVRKWRGTTGLLRRLDGSLMQGYYEQFDHIDEKTVYASLWGQGPWVMSDTPYTKKPEMNVAIPVYHPIESGIYLDKTEPSWRVLLAKHHTKTFFVGLNGHTHSFTGYNVHTGDSGVGIKVQSVDLLTPVPLEQFNPDKPFGCITKKIFWARKSLFYCGRTIGIIEGWKINLDHEMFMPFLKPLMGPKCQLSVL
jgi:hypothetical protein